MPKNAATKIIYSNHVIQAPDGTTMCRAGEDRTSWYLERGLAVVVSEEPFTIRLNFEPAGRGHADDIFYLGSKENKCVVCGSEKDINKHHVVPRVFRRHLPDRYKNRNSHDIVILCVECHVRYEVEANEQKHALAQAVGFCLLRSKVKLTQEQRIEADARYAASTLRQHRDKMPEDRITAYEDKIRQFTGDVQINPSLIDSLARKMPPQSRALGGEDLGQFVVGRVDADEFCLGWRDHFVRTMRPAYLPIGWKVNNPICREA